MIKKKIVHYINNQDLVKAILDWQSKCKVAREQDKEIPQIPNYIGECIIKICKGLGSRYNFQNYSFRDEMESDGIEKCLNAIKNFDIAKTNQAFAYLTMVAFKAYQYRILVERKQQYVKHKHYVHHYTVADVNGMIHEGTDNEYTNKVIEEYERKHLNKEEVKKTKYTSDDVFHGRHNLKGKKDDKRKEAVSGSANLARPSRIYVKRKQQSNRSRRTKQLCPANTSSA